MWSSAAMAFGALDNPGRNSTSSKTGITSGGPVSGGGSIVQSPTTVGSNLFDPNEITR